MISSPRSGGGAAAAAVVSASAAVPPSSPPPPLASCVHSSGSVFRPIALLTAILLFIREYAPVCVCL